MHRLGRQTLDRGHGDSHVLSPFDNVSHSNISQIYIDVNESRHIYLSRFINTNINVENAKMTYIVKRRKYMYKQGRS